MSSTGSRGGATGSREIETKYRRLRRGRRRTDRQTRRRDRQREIGGPGKQVTLRNGRVRRQREDWERKGAGKEDREKEERTDKKDGEKRAKES